MDMQASPLVIQAPPDTSVRPTKQCPFCAEDILADALKCKHCGEFLDLAAQSRSRPEERFDLVQSGTVEEKIQYEAHPAMFRSQPLLFVVVVVLCGFFVGIPILLLWWLRSSSTTLTVTNKRTVLRKGILAKSTTEVRHVDVRNIKVTQSVFERMFDVGALGISSAAQAGIEVMVAGIPRPAHVRTLIDRCRG